MTVRQLAEACSLSEFSLSSPDMEVTGGYACDLLSWAMGRVSPADAWLTIISNVNVAAVAVLTEAACVILTEGIKPDDSLLNRAREQKINLLGSDQSSFVLAVELGRMLA